MGELSSWRPKIGEGVALSDRQLAQVGLIALLEARAKTTALGSLKALEGLSTTQWLALDKIQFKQIVDRLLTAAEAKAAELIPHVQRLETLRSTAQDLRHMIVHGMWAIGPDGGPTAYDQRRHRLLNIEDINNALEKCNELASISHALMYRVAHLVEAGRLPEGSFDEPGPSISTGSRLVHL